MDTVEKLKILSKDSQYDLACACGTSKYDRRKRSSDGKWLYPVPLPQGGYSVLLKTLLSNACSNDCKYCPLRSRSNVQRCTLSPEETAKIFMEYLKKSGIFGLFLSSGVINSPDYTMDKLNTVARILRKKYAFRGYIHLKMIPGASDAAFEDAMSLASAVSLNIETPGKEHFKKLSDVKNYDRDIIHPLKLLGRLTSKGEKYSKVKCTTQFIVGASDETDSEIVKYMFGIYRKLNFRRVYFSAYQPGYGEPEIPGEKNFNLGTNEFFMREHRLYQADFLIRQYGFESSDMVFENSGNFSLDKDPKEIWAERHPEFFPVNINTADKESLLRIPGIGHVTVNRILKFRKIHRLRGLGDIWVKGKTAQKASRYAVF